MKRSNKSMKKSRRSVEKHSATKKRSASKRHSASKKRSTTKRSMKGGQMKKRSFKKPRVERNTTKSMKVLDAFVDGKLSEAMTVKALQELYCPTKLNTKYKKDVLDKLKKGELTKEEAERKLHFFVRLEHEFVPKNNANKRVVNKKNNNNKRNNNNKNNKKNNNNK